MQSVCRVAQWRESQMAEYPEHEKLHLIKDKSQAIYDFISWLSEEGIHLAEYHRNGEWLERTNWSIKDLLAKHFDIDQNVLENEKQAMLEVQRKLNDERADFVGIKK